jgi:antitoxin component of MazEF toxin-antitoxin module
VKLASQHLRKFIQERSARQNKGKTRTRRAVKPGKDSQSSVDTGATFTLKVGLNGTLGLPPALQKMLGLSEGDHLEVKVIDSRIVSGVAVPKDEAFDPKTVARLMKRLNSPGVNLTPSELRTAVAKGKCNG